MSKKIAISVIITVLNEADSIDGLLDSLARQTRRPDQVVVVDGGSTDGTLERLHHQAQQAPYRLVVISLPGSNISQGRNAAIGAASGDIIAATDAGVRLEDDWLERLVAPFEAPDPPDVVSGFFVADPRSLFELALGASTLPLLQEIDPARFAPSSRSVAFRRTAWQKVGGYPEWLDYCEDLVYDFALRDAGFVFAFAPDALAHFRPRPTLRAFFKQYYRYARGDGKADLWIVRHLIRYGTYLVGAPLLVALALAHHPLWWLGLAIGGLGMMRTPLRRTIPHLRDLPLRQRLAVLAWLPLIRVTGDVAKMLGYPVGVFWRLRHAPAQPWSKRHI
ncbi:MAG TPA: glycosyltransferase [Chloroflexi bacterium]|jgi:glycosyltransferase involved in cell wall biosynthesis|nr:glycosyltransferase [Chloroflexota bacterium]